MVIAMNRPILARKLKGCAFFPAGQAVNRLRIWVKMDPLADYRASGFFIAIVMERSLPAMETPVIDLAATGRNISRLRQQSGLSVRALQKRLGLATPQAIYKWQQGLALPTVDNLVALAAILNCTLEDILIFVSPDRE